MLKWYRDCYVGGGIEDFASIREKVEQGSWVRGLYLLTLSENPDNIMELLPSWMLKQELVRENCPEIIGMAKGKDAAMELAAQVIQEVYEQTGTFRLQEYLENR